MTYEDSEDGAIAALDSTRRRLAGIRASLERNAVATTSREPPSDNGKRLATLRRSELEEIRVNWSTYEGKPFLSIRLWKRDDSSAGWWPDKARGITIRVRELADFADGVAGAIEEVSSMR